ncbi:phosphatidate cytidylyltransferase [Hymenobacter sp. H14-R3]|uniref:phosphatidate cytidylyltransferase n=1 Tax=Hymenobacter sp. H14-R3 TaxID=3046308 RepID=UPI0024B967C4|nr:phosphatidate cytidylyltransferase [Hymenobacter sp. H14-R3]MDJ0367870.1 phosphatidate cytidylyltransferase [Hymenobacter sp. H14-R3]
MNSDATLTPAPADKPKGPSNLRLRAIWGALAAVLLISCTFGGPISFGLFFAAVQAVMLKEFYRIMRAKGYQPAFWWGIVVSCLAFLSVTYTLLIASDKAAFFKLPDGLDMVVVLGTGIALPILTLLYIGLPVALIIRAIVLWPKEQSFDNIGVTLLGLLYVSLPMTLLNYLALSVNWLGNSAYESHFAPGRVFCLILFVWAADTGAYFAGKNFGKHKLAPSISPAKTWEGWAGGAALALATGWAAGYFLPDIPLSHRLVAAGVVAVFGPLGDLAESMLKRSAGVKDSGTFLPGHGGLLDRFDAFLLVLPVLALLQVLFG